MVRENRIWYSILITVLMLAQGCAYTAEHTQRSIGIPILLSPVNIISKSPLPQEDKISDVNIFIFNSSGQMEKQIYSEGGVRSFEVKLLEGEEYTIAALVNFGIKVNVSDIGMLNSIQCHLVYPDEYKEGIPMYVPPTRYTARTNSPICLKVIRMMSKISIRIDRSKLSEDVKIHAMGIRIGNCPKRMYAFQNNRVENEDDCFSAGFSHSGQECAALNITSQSGISEEVSVYMLENMQGAFCEEGISEDSEKVFSESDRRARTCSYIEVDLDYSSGTWVSSDRPLTYRFYLGESLNNLDIQRNCHYRITICPENDGLTGDGWRVDKEGMKYVGETSMKQYPSDYIVGDIGDKIHIGCIITPSDTPFDVGIDDLEFDKKRGIYEYEIDEDGHGVTLTLTGPGTGLIYMEAGPPINDSALFLIEVNLP